MTWGKIYKNMRSRARDALDRAQKRGIAYKPKPSYNQIQANQQRKQLIKDIAWKQKISVEQAEQMLKNAAKDIVKSRCV